MDIVTFMGVIAAFALGATLAVRHEILKRDEPLGRNAKMRRLLTQDKPNGECLSDCFKTDAHSVFCVNKVKEN